jgi:tetratricopeptide (TPR) repeat protein
MRFKAILGLAGGLILYTAPGLCANAGELKKARDRQDRAALGKLIGELSAAADKQPGDANAHYQAALAGSYLAEVSLELRMRNEAKAAAETAIKSAERAVQLKPGNAEYHRILGTLCGQVIPANVLAGLRYGKCAQQSVNKAVELDPKSSEAWLSHGVGNYYLPAQFGGGLDLARRDFEKALQLNPKSADAWFWLGLALRKANQNNEARKAFQKPLELNPDRVWTKQLLDRTPAQ